jgi:hypothetical protein
MLLVGEGRMDVQLAEAPAQLDLLLQGHRLVAEHQHAAFGQQLLDLRHTFVAERQQLDATQFGADVLVQVDDAGRLAARTVGSG